MYESYGAPDVLKVVEIETPEVPEDGVLVRVHASSINVAEWYTMTGLPLARIGNGFFKPKDTRLGADFSGVVEAVGKNVSDFKLSILGLIRPVVFTSYPAIVAGLDLCAFP